jgi:hypothetical protein
MKQTEIYYKVRYFFAIVIIIYDLLFYPLCGLILVKIPSSQYDSKNFICREEIFLIYL